MENLKCIIWDLDETLLDTSKLKCFRNDRNWSEVKKNFHLVREYKSLLQVYNTIHTRLYSIIITNSPVWYGNTLLNNFQIRTNLFFGYGSTTKHKPNPAPFYLAMKKLKLAPNECLSIGDSVKDFLASKNSSLKFIGVTWGETTKDAFVKIGAEHIVSNPKELLKIVGI